MIPNLGEHIQYVIDAHADHSKNPKDATRRWDGQTTYAMHPIWCGMTILTETSLPEYIRVNGCLALLYHDILEDTTVKLPENDVETFSFGPLQITPTLPQRVHHLVQEMTFPRGLEQEMREIWEKEDEVKLLKVYDKVSNLLDGTWMLPEKRLQYEQYTARLVLEAKKKFGELNITKIAKGVLVG